MQTKKAQYIATALIIIAIASAFYAGSTGFGYNPAAQPIVMPTGQYTLALQGNTYYVAIEDPNCSDTGSGTSSQPWCTMERAKSSAVAGDTVLIRPGNYGNISFGSSDASGTNSNWIIYKAENPNDKPILNSLTFSGNKDFYTEFNGLTILGGTGNSNPNYDYLLRATKVNYLNFLNMDFTGRSDRTNIGLYLEGCNYINIKNCTFLRAQKYENLPGSIYSRFSNYVVVENCDISDAHVGIGADGDNWTVKNNHIHNLDSDGILIGLYVGVSNSLFENNHIHSITRPVGTGYHNDGIQIQYLPTQPEHAHNITIRGNRIHDIYQQIFFFNPGTGSNCIIENNLLYDAEHDGLSHAVTINMNEVVIRNNVVDGMLISRGGRITSLNNNIIKRLDTYEDEGVIVDYENYNIIRNWWVHMNTHQRGANSATLGSDIAFDNLFVDPANGDYHLAPNSQAIDFCPLDKAPAADIESNSRVDILGVGNDGIDYADAGCYEFQSGAPACTDGQTRQCGATDVGECAYGTQTCTSGVWGSCIGAVNPTTETCDSKDNDCDGQTDEGNVCCPGYAQETIANGNCSDGKDNDCDGQTDSADSGCQTTPPQTDYVAYWKFDNSLQDEVGKNNGTFQGGTPQYVQGKIGQALQFDGTDDYVETANNSFSNSTFSNGITLTAWVKGPNSTADTQIISIEGAYYLGTSDSGNFTFHINGQAESFRSTTKLEEKWHFIAGAADNSGNTKIFVDGVEENTGNQNYYDIDSLNRSTTIGSHPTAALRFNGSIDEIRIYNRALTSEEILALYNEAAECVDTPKLMTFIGQWKQGNISMLALMQKIAAWKAGQPC